MIACMQALWERVGIELKRKSKSDVTFEFHYNSECKHCGCN